MTKLPNNLMKPPAASEACSVPPETCVGGRFWLVIFTVGNI